MSTCYLGRVLRSQVPGLVFLIEVGTCCPHLCPEDAVPEGDRLADLEGDHRMEAVTAWRVARRP